MIQLNLLPNVKLELVKAQRMQRLLTTIAVIASIAAIALVAVLFSASQIQKKHINDLNKEIAAKTAKLQSDKQLGKILTIQNQLGSLTTLHASKPAASRLLGYMNQVTPVDVSITSLGVDFNTHIISVTGKANALSDVNKYVDTLKFTDFTADKSAKKKAFSNVVLSNFSVSNGVNYSITYSYDPTIFDITKEVKLIVPNQTTTRSSVEQPKDLFTGTPGSAQAGGN